MTEHVHPAAEGWKPGSGNDPAVRARAAEGDPVALTQALVAIPSVNPSIEAGGQGEHAIAVYCAGLLAGWGFEVDVVQNPADRPSVIARHTRRGDPPGRSLLLNGHLDTVGVEGMSVPAFEARLEAGRIVGRGACDMKAGVAALMAAARRVALREHGGELVVALTADEEHASLGMSGLVQAGLRADAAVVCEPTSLAIMPAHKGFVWYEVRFRGRAAHGSRPEVGIDAIRHAGAFLAALDRVDTHLVVTSPHPLLGHGSMHAGTILGGSAPSVYPESCLLTLERRTLPGEDVTEVRHDLERLLGELSAAVPGFDATLTETLARPATEVEQNHELVEGLALALRGAGVESRIEGMTAWVDAAFLNESGTPAVCFGPGSIAQAHSADEWVDVSEIATCADTLESFAVRFLT